MTTEQQIHAVAALGLLYLFWAWFRITRDFVGGNARIEYSLLHRLWSHERDAWNYNRVTDPFSFWAVNLIKALILSGLTFVFVTLLRSL